MSEQIPYENSWLKGDYPDNLDLFCSIAHARRHFANKDEQEVRVIAADINEALYEWKASYGKFPKPPNIEHGLALIDYVDSLNKDIPLSENQAFIKAEPWQCAGSHWIRDNFDLMEWLLDKYKDFCPIKTLTTKYSISDIYAAYILAYSTPKHEISPRGIVPDSSQRTISVLKACIKLKTIRHLNETATIVTEMARRSAPILRARRKQTEVLKTIAQPKASAVNTERSEAVKNLVCGIYSDMVPQKPFWNKNDHVEYIMKYIEGRTIEIQGKQMPIRMLNGKRYSKASINDMLKGQKSRLREASVQGHSEME